MQNYLLIRKSTLDAISFSLVDYDQNVDYFSMLLYLFNCPELVRFVGRFSKALNEFVSTNQISKQKQFLSYCLIAYVLTKDRFYLETPIFSPVLFRCLRGYYRKFIFVVNDRFAIRGFNKLYDFKKVKEV